MKSGKRYRTSVKLRLQLPPQPFLYTWTRVALGTDLNKAVRWGARGHCGSGSQRWLQPLKRRDVYERWCPGGRARLKWSTSVLPSSAWTSLSSRRGSHGPRKVNQTGKLHKLWKKTRLVLRDCLRWLCLRQLNLDCSHWRYWIIVPLLAQRDLIPTCFLFSQQI